MADKVTVLPDGVYYMDEAGKRVKLLIKREYLDKNVLRVERETLLARLAAIPLEPTETELLDWARENWPQMDYSAERAVIEARLEELGKAIGD